MGKRFALLVGMTAYTDERLEVTTSNQDIRALVERLRDPKNGRFDRVVPLVNQTALDLQLGIASFFEQITEADDFVLVHFAGHSLIHHQNIYLATTDTFTEEYLDATTVEVDFLRRRLSASPAQQLVLLDCGFSRIGATDRHSNGFDMLAEAFQANNRAVVIAPQLTGALVDGLQGPADGDGDGTITMAELGAYIQSQLPEANPPVIVSNEAVAGLALAFCTPLKTAVPMAATVSAQAAAEAAPLVPPLSPPPVEKAAPISKRQRYGLVALLLLLLLTAFGLYGVSNGLFSSAGVSSPESSATAAVPAILPLATETPTATQTKAATETAVVTRASTGSTTASTVSVTSTGSVTETVEATASPVSTATPTATPTATAKPTATQTPTTEPTATHSPTPEPTSEPVPMTIAARRAFLRAGPGINYRILDFPDRGTAVSVLARNGDSSWYNVVLADGRRGWLHVDVLGADDENAFAGISAAATIPVPTDDFYDAVPTVVDDGLRVQVSHTYVGTRGDNAIFQARLLPETELIQPTYPNGQELGLGLLTVLFNRVGEGEYASEQVELCMVSEAGVAFYCETVFARKSW